MCVDTSYEWCRLRILKKSIRFELRDSLTTVFGVANGEN